MSRKSKTDPKPDPYYEMKLTAQRLQDQGIAPDAIAEALVVVGLNGAARMHGREFVCDYLRSLTSVFAAKAMVGSIDAPPTAH